MECCVKSHHKRHHHAVNIRLVGVQRIASNTFERCGNIREIQLSYNQIDLTTLDEAFRNCRNLRVLDLSHNSLIDLNRDFFIGLQKISRF